MDIRRILLIGLILFIININTPGAGAQTPEVNSAEATPTPEQAGPESSGVESQAEPTATDTPVVSETTEATEATEATPTVSGQNITATATPVSEATPTPTATAMPTPTDTPTPTSTVTPLWPTDTPTPTPVWTATPGCADSGEPNEQPGSGQPLFINQTLSMRTLFPAGDVDFYPLWGKGGTYYQLTTATSEGVDTRIRVFDPTGALVAENDDYEPGSPASRVTFMAPGEGWFAVAVDSRAPVEWGCRQYTITVVDVSPPTATPTATPGPSATATRTPIPTPTATAIPGEVMYDEYEPNPGFETAANVGVNQTLNLNFNPYPAGTNTVDNDFFRLYVKVGDVLRVETTGLAEGLDTNLILYRSSGEVVAGNDDCEAGERRSCLEWTSDYTGIAYILAGPVGTIPEAVSTGSRAYSLVIKNVAGQDVAPLPGSTSPAGSGAIPASVGGTPQYGEALPWAVTPLPPTATPQPGEAGDGTAEGYPGEAAPTAVVSVRSYSLAPPTATPLPLEVMTVQITVYYDENNNRAPDTNEGVAGLSVRALDGTSNQVLGQTFTDSYGHAVLAVSAPGGVRLSVPYLSYNQLIKPPGKELFVRLTPLRLPSLIP